MSGKAGKSGNKTNKQKREEAKEEKSKKSGHRKIIFGDCADVMVAILICLIFSTPCFAQLKPAVVITNDQEAWIDQLADAIFWAEGGNEATYKYGIRSVSYESTADARRICKRTIRNNIQRFADYGHRGYNSYIEFLASRYCPLEASNDPEGLNQNFIKNVTFYMENPKAVKL